MAVRGKPLGETRTKTFDPKWDETIKWYQFPNDKLVAVRPVASFFTIAQHWVNTISKKRFAMLCTKFDSTNETWVSDWGCPCHDDFGMRASESLVFNAIVRELQEAGNPNPIMAIRLPYSTRKQFDSILQIMKNDPAHPEKGYEIFIRSMPQNAGNQKWDIKQGERIPLTEEESNYTLYDLANLIPDFSDPKVRAQHARNMKDSLARQKFYVVQIAKPQPDQDPWKAFNGDQSGQPWLEFPELVAYEQKAGNEGRLANTSGGRAKNPKFVDDDDLPPSFSKPLTQKAAPTAAPVDKPESQPESQPVSPAKAPAEVKPEAKVEAKAETGDKPECFTQWKGNQKCLHCSEKKECIKASPNDDDDEDV